MSVSFPIPHTARYIPTTNIFRATFNSATLGKYDYRNFFPFTSGAASAPQNVLQLFENTLYLVERISVGGNASEGDYLDAIDVQPFVTLRYSVTKEIVYKTPFPIVNYIDDQDIVGWAYSDKQDTFLTADVSGILFQTAALVGKQQILTPISYSIYAIEDTRFIAEFKGALGNKFSLQISGKE